MPGFFSPSGFRDPFTRRVFLYLAGPMLVVSLCFALVNTRWIQNREYRALLGRGDALVALFAEGVRLDVFAGDLESLRGKAGSLLRQEAILSVRVFGAERDLLLQVGPVAGTPVPAPWEAAVPPEQTGFQASDVGGEVARIEHPDHVEFWVAVHGREEFRGVEELYYREPGASRPKDHLGYVGVLASRSPSRAAGKAEATRFAVLTLLFLGLGGVVSLLVVSEATRPLRRLLDQVGAEGKTSAGWGVDRLSDRFASLVAQLEKAFATIRQLNKDLEARVAERTAKLTAANAELEAARAHLEERVAERTAELEHTHAQLRHAEKLSALGRLAASLAHELNNPLCGLRNCVEELRQGLPPDGEEAEIAALALKECGRMAGLTNSLRQLARPTTGHPEPVDVRSCLDAMARLTGKDFDLAGIRMVVRCAPDLPPVRAVADQLRQVCLNLLHNARDAMDGQGGTVTVAARAEAGMVAISVEDQGCGIAAEYLPRVFEPFFSTKSAVKGTGLGLSVSNGIIEQFGGRIEVETSPGLGSTFTVWLPTAEEQV